MLENGGTIYCLLSRKDSHCRRGGKANPGEVEKLLLLDGSLQACSHAEILSELTIKCLPALPSKPVYLRVFSKYE